MVEPRESSEGRQRRTFSLCLVSPATWHIVSAERCEGTRRERYQELELYHHSGELVYGSVAESGPGIRLYECNGSHLRTGNEPNQLGFFPGCRRNVRRWPSPSCGRAADNRVWRT